MRLPVSSWPWLIWHELRLQWRELSWFWWILPITVISFGFVIIMLIKRSGFSWSETLSPQVSMYLLVGILVQFVSLLASAVKSAVNLLTGRDDTDLLLSSPLGSHTVFAVRAITLAMGLFASNALPIAGLAIILSGIGGLRWLGLIPILLASVMMATSLGLLLTFALLRLIGAIRTQILSQIISSTINASIFMVVQFVNYRFNTSSVRPLEEQQSRANPFGAISQNQAPLNTDFQTPGLQEHDLMMFPVRAALGSILESAILLLFSVSILYITVWLTHRWYMRGVHELKTANQSRLRTRTTRFQTGILTAMVLKDWRQISRDPVFITGTATHMIYTVPAIFVLSATVTDQAPNLQHALPISAAVLTGNLMQRLTGELIASEKNKGVLELAPIPARLVRPAKLLTALLPTLALMAPIVLIGLWTPNANVLFVAFVLLGSSLSFGITNVWLLLPMGDSGVSPAGALDRQLIGNMLIGVLLIAWIGISIWLTTGLWMGWVSLLVAVVIPAVILIIDWFWNQKNSRVSR